MRVLYQASRCETAVLVVSRPARPAHCHCLPPSLPLSLRRLFGSADSGWAAWPGVAILTGVRQLRDIDLSVRGQVTASQPVVLTTVSPQYHHCITTRYNSTLDTNPSTHLLSELGLVSPSSPALFLVLHCVKGSFQSNLL